MKFLRKKNIIIFSGILLSFLLFTYVVSGSGMYLFSDSNISLWKANKYLVNIYVWAEDDYGYFAPLFITNLPFQLFFKFITFFSDLNFTSVFYFFATYFGLVVSTAYLVKNVNKNAKILDYILVVLFAISNPIMAYIITYEQDIAYSFIFITIFVSYLFKCKNKKLIDIADIIVLEILLLLVNSYILSTVLLVASFIIYLVFYFRSLLTRDKIIKCLIAISLFLLLNSYWMIVPISQYFSNATPSSLFSSFYSAESAYGVLSLVSQQVHLFSPFMFSNSYITDPDHSLQFFSRPEVVLSCFAITMFIFYILLYRGDYNKDKKIKALIIYLLILYLIFFYLSLGLRSSFSTLFEYLWDNVPFFNLFRAIYKFQFVINFVVIILLIYALGRAQKPVKLLLLVPMLILFSFYFRDNFYKKLMVTYEIPQYYYEEQTYLDQKKLDVRYKIFPDKYYDSKFIYTQFEWNPTGWDSGNIIKYFTKQSTVIGPSSIVTNDNIIREDLCYLENNRTGRNTALLKKTMALLNIKTIIMQNDIVKKQSSCFHEIVELNKHSVGKIDNYSLAQEEILLKFYIPKSIYRQDDSSKSRDMIDDNNFIITSSFYKNNSDIHKMDFQKNSDNIKIEYKKINPTKYRVIIHQATDVFPIIFSETFHSGWKPYVIPPQSIPNESKDELFSRVKNYDIFQKNKDDQATKEELEDFIDRGVITVLGSGDSPDFVSKDFQGTIQNDNLMNGPIAETWFKNSEDERNHIEANGYANSWIIDPVEICRDNNKCIKNDDGSYDIEFVIEFWPQRLVYIGLAVAGIGLFGSMIYLAFCWLKNRRINYA